MSQYMFQEFEDQYTHKDQEDCSDHDCNYRSLTDCSLIFPRSAYPMYLLFLLLLSAARGVGSCHSVIYKVSHLSCKRDQKETSCSNAGFMKFCPSPPNSCFTTMMANTHQAHPSTMELSAEYSVQAEVLLQLH